LRTKEGLSLSHLLHSDHFWTYARLS